MPTMPEKKTTHAINAVSSGFFAIYLLLNQTRFHRSNPHHNHNPMGNQANGH